MLSRSTSTGVDAACAVAERESVAAARRIGHRRSVAPTMLRRHRRIVSGPVVVAPLASSMRGPWMRDQRNKTGSDRGSRDAAAQLSTTCRGERRDVDVNAVSRAMVEEIRCA